MGTILDHTVIYLFPYLVPILSSSQYFHLFFDSLKIILHYFKQKNRCITIFLVCTLVKLNKHSAASCIYVLCTPSGEELHFLTKEK
jgi:hypothetical protein